MPADALDLAIANGDKSAINFSPMDIFAKGVQAGQQTSLATAFSGGLPKLPDGSTDYSSIGNTYIQNGQPATGVSLANLGLQRQLFNSAMQPQQGSPPGQGTPQGQSSAPSGSYAANTYGAESGNNPNARNPNSTAGGLAQFTDPTWADLAQRHPELKLTPGGQYDPQQVARALPVFTQENASALQSAGIQPTDPNLRVAHLLGAQGATGFLTSMAQNPNAPAASMVGPAAVKANQSLFFGQGGQPVSAQDFYARVTQGFGGQPGVNGQTSPGMGQQQGSAQPLIMGQFTPEQANAQAQALFQKGTALNLVKPGAGTAMIDQAKAIMEAAAKTFEPSSNTKDYMAGHLPGESFTDFNARNAGGVEDAKNDVTTFQKRYTGLQAAGEQSYNGLQKVQLMKNLTMQPGFYSGPLSENVQTLNQFKSIFGTNPSSALPQEAFNKVTNDLLQEQVKSMGQSGVGRVLQSEVNIMKNSIASLGITPQSNRALAEILSRVYQQNQDIAELARNVPRQPGKMNTQLDGAISAYLKQHPLFTPQEMQNPAVLGAPDAPPQSANWSPQQKQQWAQSVGLKSGDPVRFNGQVFQVP